MDEQSYRVALEVIHAAAEFFAASVPTSTDPWA